MSGGCSYSSLFSALILFSLFPSFFSCRLSALRPCHVGQAGGKCSRRTRRSRELSNCCYCRASQRGAVFAGRVLQFSSRACPSSCSCCCGCCCTSQRGAVASRWSVRLFHSVFFFFKICLFRPVNARRICASPCSASETGAFFFRGIVWLLGLTMGRFDRIFSYGGLALRLVFELVFFHHLM